MATEKNKVVYTPEELKILIDALNLAPAYLSKHFILRDLCGWSEEMIEENMRLKLLENQQSQKGDRAWR